MDPYRLEAIPNEVRKKQNDVEKRAYRIYEAVSNKDYERLKILLRIEKIDVINSTIEMLGGTVLNFAVLQGDHVSVKLLLDHGAVPDHNQPEHIWPNSTLARAICSRNLETIKLVINHGCDPNVFFTFYGRGSTMIVNNYWYKIVELNDVSILECVLECTSWKIVNNEWSQMMLLRACGLGSNRIVEYLLNQGVSVESMDKNRWTCIFYAVSYYKESIINLLVSRGANLKHKDIMSRSILHIVLSPNSWRATSAGWPKIIQFLIDNGSDINAVDINGLTPINEAFNHPFKNANIIDLFMRQRGIDIARPDVNGMTVLHRAVEFKVYTHIHDLLCMLDVDINARNKLGYTPLDLVMITENYHRFLDLLLEYGANTEVLLSYKEKIYNNYFFSILECYRLKRRVANLSDDLNINTLLDLRPYILTQGGYKTHKTMYSQEIQEMKNTKLCGNITFYDFLHAKKRMCISVAKQPGMCEILIEWKTKHKFNHYANMLEKNYLSGMRSLTPIESRAINSAEENLSIIFNDRLPSLIVYNLKKYIEIEDMITLDKLCLSEW